MNPPQRVRLSEDLGRSRAGVDEALGILAVLPLAGLALDVWMPGGGPEPGRTLAVIWSGALLAFFGGVRRGLTFSEASGGRLGELALMLALFFLGVATLALDSPALAAAGLILVGGADALAGARGEAPGYFRLYRPLQMAAAALCLVAVALRQIR